MELRLEGTPNPKQEQFFFSRARHTAYGGARGGGKSWAMRRKFVLLAFNYPKLKLLLMRKTFPELEENHILPLKNELAGFADYTDKRKEFVFPNGSRIKCGYCDTEDDVYQYQGQEYDVVGLEEATRFSEAQMQFLATCNRSTREDFTPRMYYTCNPGGVGHAWVKRLFIDRDYSNSEKPEDYEFISARVYDNTALMKSNPEYITHLENLSPELRRAHLEGDWDALMGQYFAEWRRDKHTCEPFEIPSSWKRFRAMDWGYNDPCCVLWFAVAPEGRLYVYDEYYERQRLANDVAKIIKGRKEIDKDGAIKNVKISYTVASPDMWGKRGMVLKAEGGISGECTADIFMKSKVPLLPADNSRLDGWQRVREYLRDAPDGIPYLQIFNHCENLIKEMPLLQFDPHNREDAADGNDHAPEALRYGLKSRPGKTKIIPVENKVIKFDPLYTPEKKVVGFLSR